MKKNTNSIHAPIIDYENNSITFCSTWARRLNMLFCWIGCIVYVMTVYTAIILFINKVSDWVFDLGKSKNDIDSDKETDI